MPPSIVPPRRRVFKLAVYGVMGSGKTCILSALTLPRVKHPLGLSCAWIANVQECPLPADAEALRKSTHPLHVGFLKLNEHREKLQEGDVPDATMLAEGIMAFRFEFGDSRGQRHAELIDYAGELVGASPQTLAALLRDHMKSCDGLLILAETPSPDRDLAPLAGELVKLQSAFAILLDEKSAGPRESWPVAVLFNKWDRREGTPPTPDTAEHAVNEFLGRSPPPPHASLIDAVRNAVGEENVRCFPVSAFGGHLLREDGKEGPRLVNGMMQSYGLEDGFLWTIHRAEELQVERLDASEQDTSWWACWQLFGASPNNAGAMTSWSQRLWGISPAKGLAACWKAASLVVGGDFLLGRTRHVMRRFCFKTASQIAFLVAVPIVGFLVLETGVDRMRYLSVRAMRGDDNATDADRVDAETWLESYYTSPPYRHSVSRLLVLDRSGSLALRDELQKIWEESAWERFTAAAEELDKATAAEEYLRRFPNGAHATKAEEIARAWRREKEERKNIAYLADIENKLSNITKFESSAIQECEVLYSETERLPFPDILTQKVSERQKSVQADIAKSRERIRKAIDELSWTMFVKEYDSLMKDGRVSDAAPLLELRMASDKPRAEELVKDFAKRAPALIRANVHNAIDNYAWDDARRQAETLNNVSVVKLLPAKQIAELRDLNDTIAYAEDKHLYTLIIRNKPACQDQINTYLNRAPLKTMVSNVEAYRKYLTTIAGPLDLTLSLSGIRWGSRYYSNVYSYRNDITVNCRGTTVISCVHVKSKADSESRDLGQGAITGKLQESVTVDVAITYRYGTSSAWTSRGNGGSGSWTGTIEELRRGVSIDAKGDGFTNKASFSISGLPMEPTLPPWHQ